jgi:hypothetical protein
MVEERARKDWTEILQSIADGQSVIVENALIEITQTLQHGRIEREFNLLNCTVRGSLVATGARFAESVSFTGTTFENGVKLDNASIAGTLDVRNVVIKENADFEGLNVERQAFFDACTFESEPNFTLAHFGPFTGFDKTVFAAGATFIYATFDGYVGLTDLADCRGIVNFSIATVRGLLRVANSKFSGSLLAYTSNIDGAVLLEDLEFGPEATVEFFRATIGGQFLVRRCSFKNEGAVGLRLEGIAVSGGCEMTELLCLGGFTMNEAHVSRFFWIGEVNLSTPAKHQTCFARGFNLSRLRVDGALTCTGVAFNPVGPDGQELALSADDKEDPPEFTDMRIDGRLFVMGCSFPRGANFNRTEISGVFGLRATFGRSASFEGSRFQEGVRFLPGCRFLQGAEFYFAQFDGEANFGGAEIGGQLSLRYAQFNHSLLFELKGDEQGGPDAVRFLDRGAHPVGVLLAGCSYQRLVLPNDFAAFERFLARTPTTDKMSLVYLERYLRGVGRRELANVVRFCWNDREISQMPLLSSRRLWRLLHKYATGYGTNPAVLLVVAVMLGLSNVAASYVGAHQPWLQPFQTTSAIVATFVLALATDAIRRRVWPE